MSKKEKKSIEELRRDNKALDKADMDKVKGGKRGGFWTRRNCGGVTPE